MRKSYYSNLAIFDHDETPRQRFLRYTRNFAVITSFLVGTAQRPAGGAR